MTRELTRYFDTIQEAEQAFGPVNWYIGNKGKYHYGSRSVCFYCSGKSVGFKITALSDGKVVGYPVCKTHTTR